MDLKYDERKAKGMNILVLGFSKQYLAKEVEKVQALID